MGKHTDAQRTLEKKGLICLEWGCGRKENKTFSEKMDLRRLFKDKQLIGLCGTYEYASARDVN